MIPTLLTVTEGHPDTGTATCSNRNPRFPSNFFGMQTWYNPEGTVVTRGSLLTFINTMRGQAGDYTCTLFRALDGQTVSTILPVVVECA